LHDMSWHGIRLYKRMRLYGAFHMMTADEGGWVGGYM